MDVAVAAPVAIGLAAEAAGGEGGDGDGAPLEVAGNEVPPPVEGVPVAVTRGGEEKKKEREREREREKEKEKEKWLVHYSSAQDILLVGDGDFSFSLALATAFGSGDSLVATSLDTYEALRGKYSKAESNITELKRLGATVLHGVDAKKMMCHPDLKNRRFDRIIFNLPHAGFKGKEDDMHMIKELVWGFFLNAVHLLWPYCEIHISHKTGGAYDRCGLEDLASEALLVLVEKVAFRPEDYPGYNQKRGDSARCDESFDLGTCFTFKFRIRNLKNWKKLNANMIRSMSLLGIMAPSTERGPFHLFPLDEAWPRRQHLPPPADAVHMTLEPSGVAQRRHPDFPLNFDGTVRDPYFRHQGNTRPVLITPGPLVNALHHLGGSIPPPMGIIPCHDVLAPEESWYQYRPTADAPGRDHSCLAWEHQQGLQREYGMQGQVMPAATSVSHSALLEHMRRDRELVQKERQRMMVALHGKVCGERSLCRAPE